jgi:hypothetical protein
MGWGGIMAGNGSLQTWKWAYMHMDMGIHLHGEGGDMDMDMDMEFHGYIRLGKAVGPWQWIE